VLRLAITEYIIPNTLSFHSACSWEASKYQLLSVVASRPFKTPVFAWATGGFIPINGISCRRFWLFYPVFATLYWISTFQAALKEGAPV